MRQKSVWLVTAMGTLCIGGCAAIPPRDPPELAADFKGEIESYRELHQHWPNGYCVKMPGLDRGWIFASAKPSFNVTSPEIAAVFVEAGILIPGDPPPLVEATHKRDDGAWYKYTEVARSFISTDKFNNICFGRGSELRLTLIEPPSHEYRAFWHRKVHYEFTISGMPPFTQTIHFKTVFNGVPHNGINKDMHLFYWMPGGRWGLPFSSILPEQLE